MNYTRGMAAAAQLCALAVIAIMCVFPVENNDVFINLKTGEYILEHRALPATDPFSFTAGDQPWVNHEWLSILLLFLTYKAGGLNLLILLKAFMIVLSFGVILREAGRWSGNSWLLPFLVLLTGYAASDRFIIRMHIFNNLLLAVYLAALLRWRDRGGRGLWLPVITLAWVNLHSGAIVAPLLMVVVMAGDWLQRLAEGKFSPARREPERYSFRQGLIALALHVPALCLTPYGYKTVLYPLQQASWDIYRHYVFEWMRVYSPFYIQMPVFKAFLAVAAVLVGAFIVNWRRLRISDLGLAAVGLVMGASAVRFMDILALIALAVTARQLASMNWAHGRDRFRLYHQTAAFLTALLCLVIVAKHGYRISRDPRHSGLGRNDAAYPDTAIALIDEWHIRGNVFNQYDLGSYLIWKWYPRRKVFIDGRNQVYPVEFFKEYLSVNASAANLDRVMDKYGIDCVLVVNQVPPPGSPRGVYNYLSESQVWRLVYWDDLHLMYLRDRPEYKEILKENEYRCYDPVLPPELTLGVNLLVRPQECLAELERAVRINPANVRARVLLMNSRKLLEQRKNTP